MPWKWMIIAHICNNKIAGNRHMTFIQSVTVCFLITHGTAIFDEFLHGSWIYVLDIFQKPT